MLKGLKKNKNKMTQGKTYNKSPRTINHKETKSKTNTGTTALELSVEFNLGPDATLNKLQFLTIFEKNVWHMIMI